MKHAVFVLLLLAASCATSSVTVTTTEPARMVSDRARAVYDRAIVIDTHNDMPSKMLDDGYNADVRHSPGFGRDQGETDLPRLVESGITGQFLSAFVDAEYALGQPDRSWERVQAYLDTIHAFVDRHPGQLVFATTAAQVRNAKADHKVAILIGVEGGHSIENSMDHLRELYGRGVRYMTLTWNNGNTWAGSAAGVNGTRTGGLTDFGKDVIREMNRLGMLVDVSHVSDSTFYDVIATSSAPVIASHSSARAINDHPRNMSDDMLRAIARNGGVVNVNFYADFISAQHLHAREALERQSAEDTRLALARPGADTAAIRAAARQKLDSAIKAIPRPPLSVLLDHIDHIRQVAGIDHVGIGSDFDGVGGMLPAGLDDVTRLPLIAQGLLDRGYSEQDVAKVLGGNMLRVMEQVLR